MTTLPTFNENIDNKMSLNELTFDLSLGVTQYTNDRISRLLSSICSIRNVTIKGMIADCGENLKYIRAKMNEHEVDVENFNVVVSM